MITSQDVPRPSRALVKLYPAGCTAVKSYPRLGQLVPILMATRTTLALDSLMSVVNMIIYCLYYFMPHQHS